MSCEPRAGREVGGLRPFAGADLLAVGGLHARDLEAAVGADDGEAVGLDRDDLADLAGDALRVLAPAAAWRRRSSAVLPSSVVQAPGAGLQPRISRSICSHGLPQSMLGVVGGRSGLRRSPCVSSCLMRGALPAFTRSTDFQHRLDAHREQAVEIDRAERVGGADRRLLLQQHVAGIEAVVGPEDRQAGFLLALDDRPVDRADAPR